MTPIRPNKGPRPFGPHELDGVEDILPDELAAEARLGRELERLGTTGRVVPSAGFADRVMAAVAAEPVPAPVIAAGSALRRGAALGVLASIRDAFRVALSGGFPMAARAQALALVLVVVVVAGGGGVATAGALGMFSDHPAPTPGLPVTSPTGTPDATGTPEPTDTPDATFETAPTPSSTPTGDLEPPATGEAETEEPDDEQPTDAANNGTGSRSTPTPTDRHTPKPTAKPTQKPTPEPTDEDHHETPHPSETPTPSRSPSPSPTSTPEH